MSRLMSFITQFKLRVVEYINVKTGMLIRENANKKHALKDATWEGLFEKQASFIYTFDNNVKIRLYKDSVLSRLLYDGFEKDEVAFIKRLLKKGDIFIDVGCNVGYFTLIASGLIGEEGKIICFEPSPATFQRLLGNIQINDFRNIVAINKGLSDKEAVMNLNVSESGYDAWNTFANGSDDKFQAKVSVNVSTLDKELTFLDKSKISLIKIDVEGWEKFVILGGKALLTSFSPVVMIEFTESNTFSAGYFVQEIYDILLGWGYHWFRYKDNLLVSEDRNLHYPYDNLIATKDIALLRTSVS